MSYTEGFFSSGNKGFSSRVPSGTDPVKRLTASVCQLVDSVLEVM